MATVYAATHRNGHRAALKMLHSQLSRDPSTRARFLREGYVANKVGHPGVVAVQDDGVTEDGAAYLVLELLEGETLETLRLRRGGALSLDEVLDVGHHALAALAAAHAKSIVHRDVKPENIFLTTDGRVKLLDFGLARMKDAQMEPTKTGVTIGTPEFMPPEQALGRRDAVDARSDVWGLGATLYTSITGRYVHSANSVHEQLVASATQRARPLASLAPHAPTAVARVIDRALELEMQDRWPTAAEMQAALFTARKGRVGPQPFIAESFTVPVAAPVSDAFESDATLESEDVFTHGGGTGNERNRDRHAIEDELPIDIDTTVAMPGGQDPLAGLRDRHEPQSAARPPPMRAPLYTPVPYPHSQPPEAPSPHRSSFPSAHPHEHPSAQYPSAPRPSYSDTTTSGRRGGRAIVAVAAVMLAICAGVGGYVCFKGAIPAFPRR